MSDDFSRSICEDRGDRLHEGFSGDERRSANDLKIAYRFDCGPVTEHLLVIFKTLGLVLLGDVDRLGASDVDIVGVHDVRECREAHLFECTIQLAEEFDLLFSHWSEANGRLEWISLDFGVSQTPGLCSTSTPTFVATSLRTRGLCDDLLRQKIETAY